MNKFTCWSNDYPEQGQAEIEAPRGRYAAQEWLEERWFALGRPDAARVHVRRHSDGRLFAFDAHVEGVELDIIVMQAPVEIDHDTPDEHEVNPYHAVSPLEEHAPEPATDMKLVVVMWGGDDWTKSFAATFPATMTGGAVVESALEQIQEKVRIGEVKPGRVKSVTVNDLPTPTVTP